MAAFKSDASHIVASEKTENSSPILKKNNGGKDFDRAHQFIQNAIDRAETDEGVDLKALRRRIDWKIVPLMLCCYTIQFVDKVLLNVGDSGELNRWHSKADEA